MPLKMLELFQIHGKWRIGLLGLVCIHDYHQGQGRWGRLLRKHPWEETGCPWATPASDPDTAPRCQHRQLSRTLQPMPHCGIRCAEQETCRGVGVLPLREWRHSCLLHLSPQHVQSLLEGHMTVTTGELSSLVKYIDSHQRWLCIAATVIVLLSNNFC